MIDSKSRDAALDIHGLIELGVAPSDIEDLDSLIVDILYRDLFNDEYGSDKFNPLVRGINYGITKEPLKVWFRTKPGKPIEVTPFGTNIRN